MTNEEIVRIFLRQRRSLTAFRLNRKNDDSYYERFTVVPIKHTLLKAFNWDCEEKSIKHWNKLNTELGKMCLDLEISGTVRIDQI